MAIFDTGGVSVLAARLKTAPDPQERGLIAAVLWNLSACEEIKPHLLEVRTMDAMDQMRDGEMMAVRVCVTTRDICFKIFTSVPPRIPMDWK